MAELPHSASSSDDPYFPLSPPDDEWRKWQVGDDEPKLKRCGACRNYKPMDDFYNHRCKRDGKQDTCKDCIKESRNVAS